MKTGKLKYPCKVAGVLHPAGTKVDVIEGADEYLSAGGKLRPKSDKEAYGSNQVAIILPGRTTPTIHDASHVIIDEPSLSAEEERFLRWKVDRMIMRSLQKSGWLAEESET